MMDTMQDDALAKADLSRFDRMKTERGPWESTWREIDERFPDDAGGFNRRTPGTVRGAGNFDSTHITSLERFAAAGVAITTPEERQYIRPRFPPELMKIRAVQDWCWNAGKRMYDIRHAAHTGFTVAANEDWDQLGRYGTSPMWVDVRPDRGMFYRTLHLSTCYIDTDMAGLVDTVVRYICKAVEDIAEMVGYDALTDKMRKALTDGKPQTEFELIHTVTHNHEWDPDAMDGRRLPIASRYLAIDERTYLRRSGYHSMPISVSRHSTAPGEKYGRSPSIKMLPNINGVNAMRMTTLRAGHKAVDPALVFYDDDGLTSLATKPGGLNPGLVDEGGRPLVHRLPGGEAALPYAMQDIEAERQVIRTQFLEDFYKILTDPNSRMTTTEVLEVMSKQGVLVRPFAGRYAQEKQYPISNRDLELAMMYGQVEPFPPEVVEAGAWPIIDYENPLAAMARAEATGKTLRWIEALTPIAQSDGGEIYDWINQEELAPGMAEEIGVSPKYVATPDQVAAKRQQRAQQQQAAATAQQIQMTADAYQKIAKGNQLAAGGGAPV